MATDQFAGWEPPQGNRILALYVWIATHDDGSEGIIAAIFGTAQMPLLSSRLDLADRMRPMAEEAMATDRIDVFQHQMGVAKVVSVRRATFQLVAD
jgi:hypothetical protein